MATTVTDDLTVEHTHESTTGVVVVNGAALSQQGTDAIRAEGSLAVAYRVNSSPFLDGSSADVGASTDVRDRHIFYWGMTIQRYDNIAGGGVRIRISSATDSNSAFGEWFVGGLDTVVGPNANFQRWCVDTGQPFDATTGTPPATDSIRAIALMYDFTTSNGRIGFFADQVAHGTGITLTAGTSGTPGNSVDVAANDLTNGRGQFQDVGGPYFILGRVTIGDITAATASHFTDLNQVWNFENQNVSASFHKIEFVGGTGVNAATFGAVSGSGVDEEGAGGNAFVAAGLAPFRIEAIDSDITVGMFGCILTNPVALRDDAPRAVMIEDNSAGTFADETTDGIDAGANDVFAFATATPNTDDSINVGHNERFSLLKVNTGTAGVGAYTVTWEYWNGSSWSALTDVTDGTSAFKTTGLQTVSYSIPDDWAKTALESPGRGSFYYVRARKDAGTETTRANITQIFTSMGGGVRWEHANAKAVRCVFTNMDTIRVRSGAFLKKCTISDSVAPAKSAALDLGGSDPTADTVRDLTIQNCSKGILLQGTGDVTYNLRNIIFVGNTNDIRVDFGVSDTVTINVLEGGTTPTIDNVNGSTVNVVNAVTVGITAKSAADSSNVENARIRLEAAAGGDLPAGDSVTITRVTTTASVAHTAHGLANSDKVIIRGADQSEYNGLKTISNVTTNAYDYTVSGSPTTPATGTIVASAVILDGLTSVAGVVEDTAFNFTATQPVVGVARKGSTTPLFKESPISGSILSESGFVTTIFLVNDE